MLLTFGKKMRNEVAIDARMLGSSGIGTYIRNLIKGFSETDHGISFIIIGDEEKIRELIGENNNISIVHSEIPIYSIAEQMKLPSLAKSADLLHSPHHNVPIFWRKKLVATFHDALHWDFPEFIPGYKGKLYLSAISRKIAKADAVIVPSKFTAERLSTKLSVPEDNIHIIPHGIDRAFFMPQKHQNDILRKYGLEPQKYLLYVGNMKRHKNIDRMAQAYSLARQKGLSIPFVFSGKLEGLRQTIDCKSLFEVKGVKYIGETKASELPVLYSFARAFIFVSLYEGFGLPPLEAMSCGCPVLTSNVASLPEVVGDAALKVDPMNIEEIADGIFKISLDDKLRQQFIEKGFDWISNFNWKNSVAKTIEVYKRILEG